MRGNRTHLVRCADCGLPMANRKFSAHQRKKHDPPEQSKDPAALTPRGLVVQTLTTTKRR